MNTFSKLDKLLKNGADSGASDWEGLLYYAAQIARIENAVAVVSDFAHGVSRIFSGRLGETLGIGGYEKENSIWEEAILNLMSETGREEKFLAELRFYNFLRHIPRRLRPDYYMMSQLRMRAVDGQMLNIVHRMYYVYAAGTDAPCHALCLYSRMPVGLVGKGMAVNSLTGVAEELTSDVDVRIISKRECQVLRLIDAGHTSAEIAALLSISKNTVSRHRQEILAKLRVKNSVEACRLAKTLGLL